MKELNWYLCFIEANKLNSLKGNTMKYYVKHYDDNNQLFQTVNVKNDRDLQMYKDIQMSQGDSLLVYCTHSDKLVESYDCI